MQRLGLGAWLLVAVITADTRAEFLIHTTRSSFEASTYQHETVTFEGLAEAGSLTGYLSAAGLTEQGITFTGVIPDDYWLFVVDPAFTPEFYDWASGAVLLGPPSWFGEGARIEVALPPGTTAFGTDLMSFMPYAAAFDLLLSSGEAISAASSDFPQRTFFGLTSDTPIDSVSFVARDGAFPLLDNFTVAQTAPLPPSAILAATGLVSLLGFLRRNQRQGS